MLGIEGHMISEVEIGAPAATKPWREHSRLTPSFWLREMN
jgi:hypothetical protein